MLLRSIIVQINKAITGCAAAFSLVGQGPLALAQELHNVTPQGLLALMGPPCWGQGPHEVKFGASDPVGLFKMNLLKHLKRGPICPIKLHLRVLYAPNLTPGPILLAPLNAH